MPFPNPANGFSFDGRTCRLDQTRECWVRKGRKSKKQSNSMTDSRSRHSDARSHSEQAPPADDRAFDPMNPNVSFHQALQHFAGNQPAGGTPQSPDTASRSRGMSGGLGASGAARNVPGIAPDAMSQAGRRSAPGKVGKVRHLGDYAHYVGLKNSYSMAEAFEVARKMRKK
ncbi:hypothetical protein Tdes44962_MAKER01586 [Teratosphaeria destructans]|uniref:Uncharacterized protein n=1 Tax=Teratosphaeria destructans TaxID=418781 RepID=A0A9W7SYN9_9PEZI|nr:hypothetical protein Tdes44962_MAKER01586 [Teratosphaeria destructans]